MSGETNPRPSDPAGSQPAGGAALATFPAARKLDPLDVVVVSEEETPLAKVHPNRQGRQQGRALPGPESADHGALFFMVRHPLRVCGVGT